MGYRVAVAGATGAVGQMPDTAERNFPADKYALPVALGRARGFYGEHDALTIGALDKFDFGEADIALFSAGGETSKAVAEGGPGRVHRHRQFIRFRMEDDVPLIVPEVNPDTVERDRRAIIAVSTARPRSLSWR